MTITEMVILLNSVPYTPTNLADKVDWLVLTGQIKFNRNTQKWELV